MAAKSRKKAEKPMMRFELDGESFELDFDSFTFGEIEFIEEYFDCALDEVPWQSGRGTLIGCYIAKRRKDSTVTLDDLRDVKISALKKAKEPKRPTEKGPETSGTRS